MYSEKKFMGDFRGVFQISFDGLGGVLTLRYGWLGDLEVCVFQSSSIRELVMEIWTRRHSSLVEGCSHYVWRGSRGVEY